MNIHQVLVLFPDQGGGVPTLDRAPDMAGYHRRDDSYLLVEVCDDLQSLERVWLHESHVVIEKNYVVRARCRLDSEIDGLSKTERLFWVRNHLKTIGFLVSVCHDYDPGNR